MSPAARQTLAAFDALSHGEQAEVARTIMRRIAEVETPPLDDETLDRLADELFVELDREEAP